MTTETGAGQWGTALAMACSYFGLDCKVFMVKVSYEQKPFRREVMRTYGASVTPSPSMTTAVGRKILEEHPGTTGSLGCAISAAVEAAASEPGYRYVLGSVLNQVLLHQSVIGMETKAALDKYGAPVIVVDYGTATNIDVVDARGAYRGGAIAPGLVLSARALFARAAKLANTPLVAPAQALGYDTETAIQSGTVIGAAAMAEGLVRRIREEIDAPNATCVATGGLAYVIAEATDLFDDIDQDITLRGIWLIWKRSH